MIDIDQFKLYSDHHGHLAGDTCLPRVAGSLKATLRLASDLVARYGGEEFVVVLPGTDAAGPRAACGRAWPRWPCRMNTPATASSPSASA